MDSALFWQFYRPHHSASAFYHFHWNSGYFRTSFSKLSLCKGTKLHETRWLYSKVLKQSSWHFLSAVSPWCKISTWDKSQVKIKKLQPQPQQQQRRRRKRRRQRKLVSDKNKSASRYLFPRLFFPTNHVSKLEGPIVDVASKVGKPRVHVMVKGLSTVL